MKTLSLLAICFALTACASGSYELSEKSKRKPLINTPEASSPLRSFVYARALDADSLGNKRTVQLATPQQESLQYIMNTALPGYEVIPRDRGVDLKTRKYKVNIDYMPIPDFMEYVEALTGYELTLKGKLIEVEAFVTKTWSMEQFTTSRSLFNRTVASTGTGLDLSSDQGSAGGSASSGSSSGDSDDQRTISTVEIDQKADNWNALLSAGRKILSIEEEQGDDSQFPVRPASDPFTSILEASGGRGLDIEQTSEELARVRSSDIFQPEPFVHGVAASGIIQAGGPAFKIRQLDELFSRSLDKISTNIHVQVEIYEVVLTEGKEKGVNWQAIYEASSGDWTSSFTRNLSSSENDLFSFGATYEKDNYSAEAFVRFLETFGEVQVVSRPNTMATHGTPAVFKGAKAIPVVLEVSQVAGDGFARSGGKVSQLNVGVNLTATSWLLDSGQIMLDVMPSVSTTSGSVLLNIGGVPLPVPIIDSTDLATRVVVESGRPIILGGLSRSTISNLYDGIPVQNETVKGILRAPFGGINNSLERSELVIVVRPSIVEGAI